MATKKERANISPEKLWSAKAGGQIIKTQSLFETIL